MTMARRAAGVPRKTAGGAPLPAGWTVQRYDTFGTGGTIRHPSRLRARYNEAIDFGHPGTGRVYIPNAVINGQQHTYQHFEDATWNYGVDRLTIQGRGQGDGTIKSGQMATRNLYRSFIFEARFTCPATLGTWVEFWAYAAPASDTSELDVELLMSMNGTSYDAHNVNINNHPYVTPTGDDPNFSFSSVSGLLDYNNAAFNKTTGPHTYTIYYDDTGAGTTRRYIDGKLIYHAAFKWNASVGGTGFGNNAQLVLGLAVGTTFGGNFPGTVTSPSTWSGNLDLYSIAIYAPGAAARAIPVAQAWNFDKKNGNVALSGNDLIATTSSNLDQAVFALDPVLTTGKYYWEIISTGSTASPGSGIGTLMSSTADSAYVGLGDNAIGWYNTGSVLNNNAVVNTWATYGPGTVLLCFALDMTNFKLWGRVGAAGNWNNAAIGSQNPATNTGGYAIPSTIRFDVLPAANLHSSGDTVTGVFASASWTGTAPSGFGAFPT